MLIASKWVNFADKEIDDAPSKPQTTYDVETRKKICRDIELRLLEAGPYVWINFREQAEATQAFVQNYAKMPGTWFSQNRLVEVWLNK